MVHARYFPARASRGRGEPAGGARARAVELRRGGARRARAAARAVRHERAAPEPAVPRLAHAARAHARRLHRQRQRRTHAARSAARRCSTRGARSGGCADQGYERIGILGTSLGSCLSMLTAAHEPLVAAQALNHISPYFADVVWRGLSTRHVREGLEGHVDARRPAAAVGADQPVDVPRPHPRQRDAAGLREVRPDVSRRSLAHAGERVPASRHPARAQRAAVRPLQHRRRAVQVPRRATC